MNMLNLGSGKTKLPEHLNIDIKKINGVDILADIQHLPFKSNTIDHLYCSHVLEHMENLTEVMGELHRILKPSGILKAIVPHYGSLWAQHNPEHKINFTIFTMNYYSVFDEFHLDFKYKILEKRLEFRNKLVNSIFNLRPEFLERFVPLMGIINLNAEIIFKMEAQK